MNKAYLLAICLLATTLTGCLADDKTTDEKIEPVGMDDGDQQVGKNDTYDKKGTDSNITIRYGSIYEQYYANFSKIGNVVNVTFDSQSIFYDFIWFIDYDGNEIRHNQLYDGFDNCYSNGNWSAWDSNGSADCFETYELQNSNGNLANSTAVIWEFNLAREPMSVAIGQDAYYFLESF